MHIFKPVFLGGKTAHSSTLEARRTLVISRLFPSAEARLGSSRHRTFIFLAGGSSPVKLQARIPTLFSPQPRSSLVKAKVMANKYRQIFYSWQ